MSKKAANWLLLAIYVFLVVLVVALHIAGYSSD